MTSRRSFLATALGATALGMMPSWSLSSSMGNVGRRQAAHTGFDLAIDRFPVTIGGRRGAAIGINGMLPAPLLRMTEGDDIEIRVTNRLDEDTSIHWHGLLLPFYMDGVPGVSFPGIAPDETFTYRFQAKQTGTYWYHSHSGLQEQLGHYGPLIIDPAGVDPITADREYVLVLSDWMFADPYRVYRQLKGMPEAFNSVPATVGQGLAGELPDMTMWGQMRMSPRDISDIAGNDYRFLINGHATEDGWNAIFNVGERVRLRIINASAMTIFNFRIPGLPMTVVQSDGQNVQPVETDEFQIGVAETYDVVVEPPTAKPYALVAEAIERSGQVVATLGPTVDSLATVPQMRPVPTLTMRDMGHGTGHHAHHGHAAGRKNAKGIVIGPGVVNVATAPESRLHEPGIGLEDMNHRVLTYTQLRSVNPNPDQREPSRELEVHLTSNMERYMWSFNGVRFSEVTEPIALHHGERVRMTLVNNTMMSHPIHLHGMFFELCNGGGSHKPHKHTVIVKPGEKLAVDISADAIGDWAFHCHLLMHMIAGMMQVVSIKPTSA